jgi:formylglycine-generating enzyme required for sulfatase activity
MTESYNSSKTLQVTTMNKVFISYSHHDKAIADKLKKSLALNGITIIIDSEGMAAGENIQQFIEDSIRNSDVTLSIVSNKSIESAWVALESITTYWQEKFERGGRRLIPCYIDPDFLDDDYSLKIAPRIEQEIEKLEALIGQHAPIKLDPEHLQSKKTRLYDLRNNLPRILLRFRDSLTLDIREEKYDQSLKTIIETIKSSPCAPLSLFEDIFNRDVAAETSEIDHRFVRLTMLMDKGESSPTRYEPLKRGDERETFDDLLKLVEGRVDDETFVLLGAPGSGKTTLLKRFQVDFYRESVRTAKGVLPFFVRLSQYDPSYSPNDWLVSEWSKTYGETGLSLSELLKAGKVILLLDALNEMPHRNEVDFARLVDKWYELAVDVNRKHNRILISCRSLDYSKTLSRPDFLVPNIEIQPLTPEKIQEFLGVYLPNRDKETWEKIQRNRTADFYQTPYFLSLLCRLVKDTGEVPDGRASLFTAYIRQAMERELKNPLLIEKSLLNENDRNKIALRKWESPFQLPGGGGLPGSFSELAYAMQKNDMVVNKQVSLAENEALKLIGHDRSEDMLRAGVALNLLNKDIGGDEPVYRFQHQLLQEYFAARTLAASPKLELVRVPWSVAEVRPKLAETIAKLGSSDRLRPLAQTGWEETTLTAAAMVVNTRAYIEELIDKNLPLAARCAILPELDAPEDLKSKIRWELISRMQNMQADLRARIAAGEALGLIGDPRFKLHNSNVGEYLLPPMVEIPAGNYPIGAFFTRYVNEMPKHKVQINAYEIGIFPVTNAEYKKFIEAGGYEKEHWWDTANALRWLREGGAEDQKQSLRDARLTWQNNWTDDQIKEMVKQNRATEEQVEEFLRSRNSSDEEFERQLDESFPGGAIYREPHYWNDSLYNNPAQPVVGVSWYEARAYCKWLSEATGEEYRLPTEVEYEAAARGKNGRKYSYGRKFDKSRCNTFEGRIRQTTPVGIFDNRTPEGAYDLTGNVWTWTTTIYDEVRYRYPYRSEDGREDAEVGAGSEEGSTDGKSARATHRVIRGGSWYNSAVYCRSAYRGAYTPGNRGGSLGFRLSRTLPLALLPLRAE